MLLIPGALAAQDARRAESPRPSTTAAQARRDSVVNLARQQLGRRYRFGGTGSSGFDCSGFTRYLMRAMGHEVPRTAAQQAQVGRPVPRDVSQLRAGDLLTFGRGGRVTHIGMYIGNGRYIHASSRAGRIVEADLQRRHLVRAWNGVRRFLADPDSAPTAVAARTPSTVVPVPAQR
ncbi:MAG TPA: C40 family peptidase [Longimicrobium sp.]|nr:C40 family peptidase [Longimicrobium sp.]